jgi:hypothetical protein
MIGIIGTMVFLTHPPILYLLFIVGISVLINFSCRKLLGPGDTESLGWIITGLGMISIPRLLIFIIFFLLFLGVHLGTKKAIGLWGCKAPGMPVIMGAFIITTIVIC